MRLGVESVVGHSPALLVVGLWCLSGAEGATPQSETICERAYAGTHRWQICEIGLCGGMPCCSLGHDRFAGRGNRNGLGAVVIDIVR